LLSGRDPSNFSSTRSTNFTAANISISQITSRRIIFISAVARLHLAKHKCFSSSSTIFSAGDFDFVGNRVGELGSHAASRLDRKHQQIEPNQIPREEAINLLPSNLRANKKRSITRAST
jgi:hypothetical protein